LKKARLRGDGRPTADEERRGMNCPWVKKEKLHFRNLSEKKRYFMRIAIRKVELVWGVVLKL
jgi:hypothetical protein